MAHDTLVLIIDNYDSFVYNLVHRLAELGARSIVVRNDEISLRGVERLNPDRIIISPGPGSPLRERDVGISLPLAKSVAKRIPTLGVCLGHQVVGVAYGARIRRARRVLHGKVSLVEHYSGALYRGVPKRFTAMRYHSLAVEDPPEELVVTARSVEDGEIMGLKHAEHPIHGVQFHPESVGTPEGHRILRNFLDDPY